MRNKKIGVAVWVTGLILMANYSVFIDTQDIRTRVVLTLFIIAFSPIAIYSWLWGRQKGHFAHLIIILLYAFLAIILNVEKYIGILYFTFFIFLYLCILIYVVLKYRKRFVDDFNNGISRNYFNDHEDKEDKGDGGN